MMTDPISKADVFKMIFRFAGFAICVVISCVIGLSVAGIAFAAGISATYDEVWLLNLLYILAVMIPLVGIGGSFWLFFFARYDEPNKSPEPTTTAVTSPAAQEPRQR